MHIGHGHFLQLVVSRKVVGKAEGHRYRSSIGEDFVWCRNEVANEQLVVGYFIDPNIVASIGYVKGKPTKVSAWHKDASPALIRRRGKFGGKSPQGWCMAGISFFGTLGIPVSVELADSWSDDCEI
jgi:hypothetical protein